MVALFVMRKTHADVPRPYKVPLIIPIFVLCISIFLSVTPIIKDPSIKYLFALGFILIGVAVYSYFIYGKKRPKFMSKFIILDRITLNTISKYSFILFIFADSLTFLTQVMFEAVPPVSHED